jgi:retron-type reverse transcriptase
LPAIFTVRHFAEQVDMHRSTLGRMCCRQSEYYAHFEIPKADGTSRGIASPRSAMRRAQRWIQHRVLRRVAPHLAAHGFVPGRSIVTHAQAHVGKSVVVRLDIENFFPSVSFRRVRQLFEAIGYPSTVAASLANLCTLDGKLPQGAITSPDVSNLVLRNLDRRLSGLGADRGFGYTRYADDLTFSSNDRRLTSLLPFFKQIVAEEGFAVREEKTRIMRSGRRQTVTGVVVNEQLNLPRAHRRLLRAAAHRLSLDPQATIEIPSRRPGAPRNPGASLQGHLAFLAMVRRKG